MTRPTIKKGDLIRWEYYKDGKFNQIQTLKECFADQTENAVRISAELKVPTKLVTQVWRLINDTCYKLLWSRPLSGEFLPRDDYTFVPPAEQAKSYKVEELGLYGSTVNALKRNGIFTTRELCCYSDKKLLGLKGVGRESVKIIKTALTEKGLKLKNERKGLG